MRRYTPLQLLLSFLAVLTFMIIITQTNKVDQSTYEKNYKGMECIGRVTKKFIDIDNHSYERVVVREEYKEDGGFILNVETSGLYEFLQVNDSIIKKSGTLDVRVIREDLDTTLVMSVY